MLSMLQPGDRVAPSSRKAMKYNTCGTVVRIQGEVVDVRWDDRPDRPMPVYWTALRWVRAAR